MKFLKHCGMLLQMRWVFFTVLALLTLTANAQMAFTDDDYPTVGKRMPPITIRNIDNFRLHEATLADFLGKWLILDFWNKGCTTCIHSFPKVNALQKKYKDRIQIVLVGLEDKQQEIRPMYEAFKKNLNLELPCSIDSFIFKRLDIYSCPHVVIVDSAGIVRVVTSELNAESLGKMLAGKQASWISTYFRQHDTLVRNNEIPMDVLKPLLINNNGGPDTGFIFRSLLFKWKPGMPYALGGNLQRSINNGIFQVSGISILGLYSFAYVGKYLWNDREPEYGMVYPEPVLQVKDSSKFFGDYKTGNNVYCYSFIFPKGSFTELTFKENLRTQLDSYCKVKSSFEEREMPYWALLVKDSLKASKITTKGEVSFYKEIPHVSISAKNVPIKKLLNRFISNVSTKIPFIDETGIKANVDINLECILSDIASINGALSSYGLELLLKTKKMKVVVISE